jgi:hypothetical protein
VSFYNGWGETGINNSALTAANLLFHASKQRLSGIESSCHLAVANDS